MRAAIIIGCLLFAPALHAEPGTGTQNEPVRVDAFPYAIAGTSVGADSAIESYDCSPSTDESGPEVVYRFELGEPARVSAWVEGDGGGVDIDVHLMDALAVSDGVASGCVARGDVIAEAEMTAGVHRVVVDSFNGDAQAGDYVLHLEAIGDAWIERPVAEGVSWRARRFLDQNGPQVVHGLVVDTHVDGVSIRAIASNGCQTVGAVGEMAGAVAGINGGYFGGGCAPVSLLKASGALLGSNAQTRGAFGMTMDALPLVALVAAGQDWPEAHEAHGGGPILVTAGVAQQGAAAWASESFTSASFIGDNPRSFAGIDAQGRAQLFTVDGRRNNAAGMSLDELAAFAQGSEVGLSEAVNLDGGGSSTLWVDGLTPNGVLNYPSDAPQEDATHPGSRPNSGGLFVFAPAYNHPPRFQTEPVVSADAGKPYRYDADAIDLDVDDVITFTLIEGPDGMTVDADSGIVAYAPTEASPPSADVVIEASDDAGASSQQAYNLNIVGGMGVDHAGGGGAGGGGEGGSAGDPLGTNAADGCGCALVGEHDTLSGSLLWLALALALAWRGRRSHAVGADARVHVEG